MSPPPGDDLPQPSSRAEGLLRGLIADPTRAEYVLGDLREEYATLVLSRGRALGDLWYWAHVVSIGGRAASRRFFTRVPQAKGTLAQDIRFAFRSLRKRPWLTSMAILGLGAGIAGTTAMVSIVDAVFLKPLPYENPRSLVSVWRSVPDWRGTEYDYLWDHMPFGWSDAQTIQENARFFSEVGLFRTTRHLLWGGSAGVEEASVGMATAGFFRLLRLRPEAGRFFSEEEAPGSGARGPNVAILSHELWVRRFGSNRSLIGQTVSLNGTSYTVIGVLPPGFRFSSDGYATFYTRGGIDEGIRDIWIPLPEGEGNEVVARLASGATVEQAQAEVQSMISSADAGQSRVESLARVARRREFVSRGYGPPLLLLLGAAATLLLVSCVSVAGLLLAEGVGRRGEMAVRTALGASRWRIIRLLLVESMLLGLAAATVGTLLAWLAMGGLLALAPPIPRAGEIGIDLRVLLAATVVGVGSGVLSGLIPAWRGADPSLAKMVGGRGQTSGREKRRLQDGVLAVQVALTVVLLVAGGLFGKSVVRLMSVEPGFDPERVVALEVVLPPSSFQEGTDWVVAVPRLWREMLAAAAGAPGIESVSAASSVPFGGLTGNDYFSFQREGTRVDVTAAASRRVWPDFHVMMGIDLVEGRLLGFSDGPDSPAEMVVSRSLAELFWPEASPVGTTVDYHGTPVTIVGVVTDVRSKELGSPPDPLFYLPLDRFPMVELTLVARASGRPEDAMRSLRQAVLSVKGDIGISSANTMASLMRRSEADDRFRAVLVLIFATLGTLLAALGIFGVTAKGVASRYRELGIRKAVGATDAGLVRLVLSEGLRSTWYGSAMGLVAALAVSRLISHFLFEVENYDPVAFIGGTALLALVCLSAAYLPARRVTRIAPMRALASE